jgi:gas vesicle protein
MKGSSKVLVGFIAGVAAGAGIYALLKSEKGQELVNEIKDVASKWKEEIDGLLQKGKDVAEDVAEEAAGEASTA